MKTNTKRPLETIAHDIRALERGNAFAIGALLAEARDDAEYGEWAMWLEEEFDWSPDTARNYMAAHRLADKFRTVRELSLPMRAVYQLGNDFELDDPDLLAVIEALTAATKGKSKVISVAEAQSVIDMTLRRIEHGDHPDATLNALASLRAGLPWGASAVAALKAERPTTAEAAEQVKSAAQRAYVTSLYAPVGGLPDDVPDDALWELEEVAEKLRGAVLQKLEVAERPLTDETICDCIHTLTTDDARKERREQEAKRATKELADAAAERAAEEAARQAAARAQQHPGTKSPAEIERKLARLEELEAKAHMLERVKLAQQSEIEELKAQAPVRPSLVEALETALELAREAARHDGGLSTGKAKKREKALTDIRSSLALLMELEKEAKPRTAITADPPEMRM